MEPVTRKELCQAMAQEFAMKMTIEQTEKFANTLNNQLTDKVIFKHFSKIGHDVKRLSGGRYYLNANFS